MSTSTTPRRAVRAPRTRILALLAAFLLSLAALALQAPAAQAHDELLKTDPSDGATLKSAPEQLTMSFSGDISTIGNRVVVSDSHGKNVAQGDPQVKGTTLTQKLSAGSSDETYTVTWRVVSQDGHPVQGKYGFTVGEGGSGSSSAPASAAASDAASSSAAQQSKDDSADTSSQDSSGLPLWAVALIGAALALAVLGVVGILVGRSRQAKQDSRDHHEGR